ncbi:Hydroxyacid-oxoacid transhydrogenase [Yarrowia sp. C11]|nr:Hydroxyacid-oxoacid transhydrogenase [Yarrowia sp. C11]KAG5370462.1 Hydroxyacid-oxoacid transhydrogenase [Yarrowia sp. E02]
MVKTSTKMARNVLRTIQANPPPGLEVNGITSQNYGAYQRAFTPMVTQGAGHRNYASDHKETEYAFQMAASNIRYGPGVTAEVGYDFKNMRIDRVAVFTDKNLLDTAAVKTALQSLDKCGIKYDLYSDVCVEPKEPSVLDAIAWGRAKQPKAYLAIGGGSVMDTAKMANLYQCFPEAELLDFVNAPIGKAQPIDIELKPLIAVPTTAGTGSETTGTAIFDLVSRKAKTGIANRALKPLLGIVDPLNSATMPEQVKAASGLDVLCHSLESYTAIPYQQRTPRPANPNLRPAYQGSNPIADIFSLEGLRLAIEYLPRSCADPEDMEAHSNMLLGATLAGVGFGNAGVHICHGLSYPISGMNTSYYHPDYHTDHPLVPHGISVAVTAPSVFKFTAPSDPERHLKAASLFGVDVSNVKKESAGEVLAEAIQEFMFTKLKHQPRGVSALGYKRSDISALVDGAVPQRRVLDLAPGIHGVEEAEVREALTSILEDAWEY